MLVAIIPPGVSGSQGYMISRDRPSMSFATEDGGWVDFSKRFNAVQFATARDAIQFAERRGWTVMNKKDGNSLIDVPRDRWL